MPSRRVLPVLLAATVCVLPATAQNAPKLPSPAALSYVPTLFRFSPDGKIKRLGTVYIVRTTGLIGQPATYGVVPTNTVLAGQVQPLTGFAARFGAIQANKLTPGDHLYLHDVAAAKGAVLFTFVAERKVPARAFDYITTSRIVFQVRFPMSPDQIAALSPESLHRITDGVFAPEPPSLTPAHSE